MRKVILVILAITSLSIVFALELFGRGGELTLTIPIIDMKGHIGKCEVNVLDPDDNIVGSTYRYLYVNSDAYSVPMTIKVKKDVPDYDLLRARVTFKKQVQIYSLFQLQDRMIVKIIGQDEFIKGTPCTYRIIVKNQSTNEPVQDATVIITLLLDDNKKEVVFSGETDRTGESTAEFMVADEMETARLLFEIASDMGKDEYDVAISFVSGNMTYLVTDKPIYQPGQMIHIRTLSLQKPGLAALANKEIAFEVEDSKGNKVFKKTLMTDKYGTAYVPFVLANEVNFGDYTVRANLIGEKTEKTVKVEKYVLPKFKIALETEKEFYLPGEAMEGNIDVQYFFGKPVAAGKVKITTFRYDIGFQQEAVLEGKTDGNGRYHFTYQLPGYFVGEPLEQGDAFIRLDVEVIDNANHSEKLSVQKKVVQDVIGLSIVPEGGILRPNLENRIYVLASYPDGSPCVAKVILEIEGRSLKAETDSYGVAEFLHTPQNSSVQIKASARDEKGETADLVKQFSLDVDRDQLIMRMARGIYKVGDKIDLQFLATKQSGRVYIDVIKDNQTVLTKSVSLSNGKGAYPLSVTPDITGSIWLHAYIVTPGSDIVRDTRFCYVHAADDLVIQVKGDKEEYLPGAEGSIRFSVTDKNGRPKVAALCVAIVDEAVFAVSELQPGLEKVYFRLEKEIMTPRYEIHGFEPVAIVGNPPIDARAENVLFSTLEPKEPFTVNYTTPQVVDTKIQSAFYNRLIEVRDNIYAALNKYYNKHNQYPATVDGIEILVEQDMLEANDLIDPWARKYRITTSGDYISWFNIASAGPDGVFDNADDITEWTWGWPEEEMMFDGVAAQRMAMPKAAAPVAGAVDRDIVSKTETSSGRAGANGEKKGPGEPRVREYFPETFIFEPALITDAQGYAALSVTMPDAITTWRVTSFANSTNGELGSDLSQLRVFQDFFVDIDLPVALTEGDEIS
ncbi:type II secretion system protein GspG, partial [candidate division WOR-3 bacterium]|nr:type II secretion system protein GspG [candidate division WOR-3 bacterium]